MHKGLWLIAGILIMGGCKTAGDEEAKGEFALDANGNGIPKISGEPPEEVIINEIFEFEPTARDLENDALSFEIRNKPDWAIFDAVTGRIWGQPTLADVGTYDNVAIVVSDGRAEASTPAFSIVVNQFGELSVTLNWVPPTENADGSTLTDLTGYRLYYGKVSGQYTHEIHINTAGTTIYNVDNLSAGTYYFAATAVNSAGVESDLSRELERRVTY
jgi:hypothetical protein